MVVVVRVAPSPVAHHERASWDDGCRRCRSTPLTAARLENVDGVRGFVVVGPTRRGSCRVSSSPGCGGGVRVSASVRCRAGWTALESSQARWRWRW